MRGITATKYKTGFVLCQTRTINGRERRRYVSYNWAEGGDATDFIDAAKLWKRRTNAQKFLDERPEMQRTFGWQIVEVSYP
jgi:hypothetical protein